MEPDRLLNLYFHGMLTDEEFHQLETWLSSDPAHVAHFVRESFMQRSLSDHVRGKCIKENICQTPPLDYDIFGDHLSDSGVWQALLETERTAPAIEREVESPEQQPAADEEKQSDNKRVSKFWPTVSVFSGLAALVLVILGFVEYVRSQRVVAELSDSVHAKWQVAPEEPELRRGYLELQEGFAQIDFKSGATAVLQAPCQLRLESSRSLFLEGGTLAVKVTEPKQGFLVHTHHGTVTDLGTEFGVVANAGQLETHVYDGKVALKQATIGKQRSNVKSKLLEEGQAAGIDSTGGIVPIDFSAKQFTRSLPETVPFGMPGKRIDLSDVLVGGSGFGTGDRNQMVQITTGVVSDIDYTTTNQPLKEARGYVAPTLVGVDFLFIPDGGLGPVKTSSAGHTFDSCPDTGGNGFDFVSNTRMVRHIPGATAAATLQGREYGTRENPVISLHANLGITFDLEAIRSMHVGTQIQRFTALCGLSEAAVASPSSGQ
ncbi:FecR domain-containing protein [Planctomycetota bacterium]